jgi:hypothetical protein
MTAAELIYRRELAAEFRRAAQAVALRVRIQSNNPNNNAADPEFRSPGRLAFPNHEPKKN